MFSNTFQKGFLSLFNSVGSKPLNIWTVKVKNGHTKRITDYNVKATVLEIFGNNVATTYIETPLCPKQSLSIKLPFFVMYMKNLNSYFTFSIQILDDENILRRFQFSNYQSKTTVSLFYVSIPLALQLGWNQIQLNLSEFTRRAYGTNYVETVRIKIHANLHLKNIYFSDRLYTEDEKPDHLKLIRTAKKKERIDYGKVRSAKKEHITVARPSTPTEGIPKSPSVLIEVDATEGY